MRAISTTNRQSAFAVAGRIALLSSVPLCSGYSTSAYSAEDAGLSSPRIDEIIVTGIRSQRFAELPRSAAVITADDIAISPATNVVDLLAREANLNLRSTVGNEKFSGVDVRGQGDTYSSNVLVLVDGIKINASDLSGADYSTVALDQIERIEVIRGANAVRYGNGAVGGVINIITKQSQPGTRAGFRMRGGSYDTLEAGLNGAWANERFFVAGAVSGYDTGGYRENSDLTKKDVAANAGVTAADWLTLTLAGQRHQDEYGLPGPVSAEDFDGSEADRRQASNPFDGGETDDRFLRAGAELGTETTGVLDLRVRSRDRQNEYVLGADAPVDTPDVIEEDERRFEAQYSKTFSLFSRGHEFFAGYENVSTDYSRAEFNGLGDVNGLKGGDIRQSAWFAAADLELAEAWKVSLGYRQDSFTVDGGNLEEVCIQIGPFFDCSLEFTELRDSWRNSALEAGLVFSPSQYTNWFISYASSFRNPNVDELVFAEEDLSPQKGDYIDAGVRHFVGRNLETSLALFYSRTEDEILFGRDPDDGTPVNRNADEPVRRVGGELDVRWYALEGLSFSGALGYTDAKFTGSGTTVPLVPKWTGSVGVNWAPAEQWMLTAIGRYTGSRYDGNDFTNTTYPKLDAYQVVDAKLSYDWPLDNSGVQFYLGINNLFDEVYSASAYSNTFYPMPTRNYYAGFNYKFNTDN